MSTATATRPPRITPKTETHVLTRAVRKVARRMDGQDFRSVGTFVYSAAAENA